MSEGVNAYSAAALSAMKATHTALSAVRTGAEETDLALSAVRIGVALCFGGLCSVCQPEAGQRHASEADAKFLQRRTARDRLGHLLCQFIEFGVHAFPFVSVFKGECPWQQPAQVPASCGEGALLSEVKRRKNTAAGENGPSVATHRPDWTVRGGSSNTANGVHAHARVAAGLAGIKPTMHLTVSLWPNARCSGLIGKPEGRQRHAREADAEFLQRSAARDRLGHLFR